MNPSQYRLYIIERPIILQPLASPLGAIRSLTDSSCVKTPDTGISWRYHSIFALLCCFFSEVFFLLSIRFSFAILFLHSPQHPSQQASISLVDIAENRPLYCVLSQNNTFAGILLDKLQSRIKILLSKLKWHDIVWPGAGGSVCTHGWPLHAVQSARFSFLLYLLAWTLVAAPGDTMLGVWLYTGLLFNGARFKV